MRVLGGHTWWQKCVNTLISSTMHWWRSPSDSFLLKHHFIPQLLSSFFCQSPTERMPHLFYSQCNSKVEHRAPGSISHISNSYYSFWGSWHSRPLACPPYYHCYYKRFQYSSSGSCRLRPLGCVSRSEHAHAIHFCKISYVARIYRSLTIGICCRVISDCKQ